MADDDVTRRRLADLEAQVAALRTARADPGPPAPPPMSAFAREIHEKQEAARLKRAREWEEEQERIRREAERLAPKQAKRDREIAAIREKIRACYDEKDALDRRIGQHMREIAELHARPL